MPSSASACTTTTRTVAPAALKVLRLLLLLPGGDRVQGLQEMQRARDQGELLRGEADYQLHWLYLWYEQQPLRALDLLRSLDARYPTNPLFLQRIADVRARLPPRSPRQRDSWRALLDRATTDGWRWPRWRRRARASGLPPNSIELSDEAGAIDLARTGHRRTRHGTVRRARTRGSDARRRARERSARAPVRSMPTRGRSRSRRATIRGTFGRVRAPRWRGSDPRGDHFSLFFDNLVCFVLDIRNFSTIIYIWYEGGQLGHP